MKKTVANICRVVRTYSLALWVGGLVFFVLVAQIAFTDLPSTHEAGIVVRNSLISIHALGLRAGELWVIATFLLGALTGYKNPLPRLVELVLVVAMLSFTAYSQFHIIPRMESDRASLALAYNGAEVDATPKDAPAHADFDRLHSISTKVEGFVLLCGLAVLALSSLPERSDK